MAIVFVSPAKKQKVLFWIIGFVLVAVLVAGSVIALLPEIKNQLTIVEVPALPPGPDISLNFAVVDSNEVKNLESFAALQIEFDYSAIDQSGSMVAGKIVAPSKENATTLLEEMGLKEVKLREIDAGRIDPFVAN